MNMIMPSIFKNIREADIVSIFETLLYFEKNEACLSTRNMICDCIRNMKYVRNANFDNLARRISLLIRPQDKGCEYYLKTIHLYLNNINVLYLVDFFSVVDGGTFERMRHLYSCKKILDIVFPLEKDGLVYTIENERTRREIEIFLKGCLSKF